MNTIDNERIFNFKSAVLYEREKLYNLSYIYIVKENNKEHLCQIISLNNKSSLKDSNNKVLSDIFTGKFISKYASNTELSNLDNILDLYGIEHLSYYKLEEIYSFWMSLNEIKNQNKVYIKKNIKNY